MKFLKEIQTWMENNKTDISDHMDTIYTEILSLEPKPKLIVELGVRWGDSTRIFNYINQEIGSRLISIDIEPCKYDNIVNGTFIQMDDISFAKIFKEKYGAEIDVLFIDTSHLYEHTKQEIAAWFPLLKEKALVIFHDTNLKADVKRKNGEVAHYWDNKRGVTRAIEEYFEMKINEEETFDISFEKYGYKWRMKQDPYCNGLMRIFKN